MIIVIENLLAFMGFDRDKRPVYKFHGMGYWVAPAGFALWKSKLHSKNPRLRATFRYSGFRSKADIFLEGLTPESLFLQLEKWMAEVHPDAVRVKRWLAPKPDHKLYTVSNFRNNKRGGKSKAVYYSTPLDKRRIKYLGIVNKKNTEEQLIQLAIERSEEAWARGYREAHLPVKELFVIQHQPPAIHREMDDARDPNYGKDVLVPGIITVKSGSPFSYVQPYVLDIEGWEWTLPIGWRIIKQNLNRQRKLEVSYRTAKGVAFKADLGDPRSYTHKRMFIRKVKAAMKKHGGPFHMEPPPHGRFPNKVPYKRKRICHNEYEVYSYIYVDGYPQEEFYGCCDLEHLEELSTEAGEETMRALTEWKSTHTVPLDDICILHKDDNTITF